ncbi:hypothetical protein Q5762_13510 [Streptomyces sp. P9(2023)]|uniref:hypothetical protein n=1 Tax=Streptomyces sp. P9(2023) TaxID=3064394 RepID=UPI0028F45F03|nr:hypothetical protein [Streptomyces sp. P9(2023)]MDT9689338.1 hypothetical protein [Streptomyces sp. P9(2023)]
MRMFLLVAGRSLLYALPYGLIATVLVVTQMEWTGQAPERETAEAVEVTLLVAGILTVGILLGSLCLGVEHLVKLRKAGVPLTPAEATVPYRLAFTLPVPPEEALRLARGAARNLEEDAKVVAYEPAEGRLKAVWHPAHRDLVLTVQVAADPAGSAVTVASRPRFRLTPFDAGQGRAGVREVAVRMGASL